MTTRTHDEHAVGARVPDLLIEQLALGVLDPEEARAVTQRLGGEARARERVAALQRADDELLAFHSPARAVRVIERRLSDARDKGRVGARLRWFAGPTLAAAFAAVLWFRAGPGDDGDPRAGSQEVALDVNEPGVTSRPTSVEPDTRLKGQLPHLVVHRKSGGDAEQLTEGAAVRAGDVLQVSYVAAGRRSGVIVSIDGRGAVTLHHPVSVGGSTELQRGGVVPLDHSYELDDAPQFERFVFVTGDELEVGTVLEAARALARDPQRARAGSLALPERWQQHGFVVRKTEP